MRVALSLDEMWFLRNSGAALANSVLDPETKSNLDALRVTGATLIRKCVDPGACDAVIRDFGRYCAEHHESQDFRDQYGLHERLACLHLVSEAARRVAFEPKVLRVLEAAFQRPPVVVGSLYFDKGSTQSIHRDTPAFFTNPLHRFFGVWTALEDVEPGSGPLIYYEAGHTVAPDRELVARRGVTSRYYFDHVAAQCVASGLKLTDHYPRKGDTLIWHPGLPHGGAPILDPRRSRRSIVFHYIARGVPIYGPSVFFGNRGLVRRTPNYRTLDYDGREAIDQGRPRFFHNRYDGNFDEF